MIIAAARTYDDRRPQYPSPTMYDHLNSNRTELLSKVPAVTFACWSIKISATTPSGETGGDALWITPDLGYAISRILFFAIFAATCTAQIASSKLHRFLYWSVIVQQ